MIEVIVNNVSLDLSDRTRIGLSILSSDITQLNTRVGDFTNTFTIPATKKNVQALEQVQLMTSSTTLPYRIVRATFKQDGIEIVSNAYCVINSVNDSSISLNIFTGNTDFIKEIGDLTVSELYENEDGFLWNETNVINGVDGVVFPIIKWGTASTYEGNADVSIRDLLPCLKFGDLLEKLSDKTGFSIGGSFDRDVLVTPNEFKGILEIDSRTVSFDFGTPWDWIEYNIPDDGALFVSPDVSVNYTGISAGIITPSIDKFGKMTFRGRVYFQWREDGNYGILQQRQTKGVSFITQIKDNLGNVLRTIQTESFEQQLSFDVNYIDISIETQLRTFVGGRSYFAETKAYIFAHSNIDSIFKVAWHSTPEDFPSITSDFENLPTYFPRLTFRSNESLVFGNLLKVSNLFTMKVVDVIKEVINSYQVMIKTDNYIKSVDFNYLDTLIENKTKALNWSDKILSVESIGFVVPNMAQKNHLRYKHNDTLLNDADSFFEIANENIQTDRVYVQLASEMTETYAGFNDELVCQINGLDASRIWQNPAWRILEFEKINTPFNVNYKDLVLSTTTTATENIHFARFRNFEFLKDNFFTVIQEISTDAKTLIANVMLTPMDIQEVRGSFVPVWIYSAKHNIDGYFHVNKLENYQNNIAKAELIRL